MNLWQDVVTAALVGTERQKPALSAGDGALGRLLARLDPADPEGSLLRAAGTLALWRRAGQPPPAADGAAPPPCDLEDLPRCSPAAAHYLSQMLAGEYWEVLPEWLEVVTARGQRVPEDYLPKLLNFGRLHRDMRPAILPALGKRGRWLMAQNPDWDYATGQDVWLDEKAWETGNRDSRLTSLYGLRARDPGRARDLLAQAWDAEAARERASFLAVFQTGLSMEDEPLLESSLDDRSKEVRKVAADLLARLPTSALCRRMLERVRPLLSLSRHKSGGWRVEVTLPEACAGDMIRDGIEPKPRAGVGEKAWWLIQMLGSVPPSTWCQEWKKTPKELVEAAGNNREWHTDLLEGWSLAAQRVRDVEWAVVLLTAWSARTGGKMPPTLGDWADVLPQEALQAWVVRLLETDQRPLERAGSHPALPLLRQCRRPWSVELSRAVLERARRAGNSGDGLVEEVWLCLPPSLFEEALSGWPEEPKEWWEYHIQRYLYLLRFRQDMLREIAP
jgi:uncharacterized protein DUF5691